MALTASCTVHAVPADTTSSCVTWALGGSGGALDGLPVDLVDLLTPGVDRMSEAFLLSFGLVMSFYAL